MKEQLINLKTAKLAQEVNFKFDELEFEDYEDMVQYSGYYVFGFHYKRQEYTSIPLMYAENHANSVQYSQHIDQPTQSLLQKYLREKHNIDVDVTRDQEVHYQDEIRWVVKVSDWSDIRIVKYSIVELKHPNHFHFTDFKSYEEALEKGLLEGLKLISA